ncbi:MAG: uracil-DNA glycosylase family protein [Myxococcota bacterium]
MTPSPRTLLPTHLPLLADHQAALTTCKLCPDMIGPVVVGQPVRTKILHIGQAPGAREGIHGKPFSFTAGKTLFSWFASIGVNEETYRSRVYMAAVCRCFPGKNPKGGDRVPRTEEVENCRPWLKREVEILQPELVVPIGKLAIAQLLPFRKLDEVVGKIHYTSWLGRDVDVIPLPHPSGLSTWFRKSPGSILLRSALDALHSHPTWNHVFSTKVT